MSDEISRGRGDPSLVGEVIGAYRLVSRIGHGGSATVFRAQSLTGANEVALKVSHPALAGSRNATQRFLREVQAIKRLDHPGCVQILDWGTHEDRIYIVMELVEAEDLADVLESEPKLKQRRAVSIALAAAEVLAAAHALGVVHRDMKPRNIKLLAPDAKGNERVKLVDFGLAKLFIPDEADDADEDVTKVETLTDPDTVLGTPKYMAPEQIGGDQVDGRADVYSMGIILYRMLTGRLPYEGKDAITWLLKLATKPTPQPGDLVADIHPGLDAIVLRCLRKDPDDRYASASELAADLRQVLADLDEIAQDKPTDVYSPEELQRVIDDVRERVHADRTTNVYSPGAMPSAGDTLVSEGDTRIIEDGGSEDSITAVAASRRPPPPPDDPHDEEPPTKTQKTRLYRRPVRNKEALEEDTAELKTSPLSVAPSVPRPSEAPSYSRPSFTGIDDASADLNVRRRRQEIVLLVASLIILATVLAWRLS